MRSGFVNRAGITYDALKLDRFYAEDLNAIASVINVTSGTNTGDETISTIKSKLGITVLSGNNTGDETLASIKSKLGAANTGSDGYLTATDWNIFNNKISSRWSANTQGIYYNGNVSLGATVGKMLTVYGYSDSPNKYGIGTLGDGSSGNPYRMPFYANGSERACITAGGLFGVGYVVNPQARLHVQDSNLLGATLGNYQILSRLAGNVGNNFQNNIYTLRDSSSTGWTTARLHDCIGIDSSFQTPGVDTTVWWERDPMNNIQSWGNYAVTHMTLNAGSLGLNISAPAGRAHFVSGSASLPAILAGHGGTIPALTAGTMAVFYGGLGNTTYGTRVSILGGSLGNSYLTFGDETAQIKSYIAYNPQYGQFTFNADTRDLFVLTSGAITGQFKRPATSLYVNYTSGSSLDYTYETSAERSSANGGTWYEGGNANTNWVWRSNGYGYRMTLSNTGNLRAYGTIQGDGYKSSDGTDGITESIDVSFTRFIFKNGICVYAGPPPV